MKENTMLRNWREKSEPSFVEKEIPESKIAESKEVETVWLSPEQVEEIHVDDYTLKLFNATRIEPMSLLEMKRRFAEPHPMKAQTVMDSFMRVGLVTLTPEGKYYSKYPENYINYSKYRYDSDLESRKDTKIFQLMKDFSGKPEYWKDKTYFSIDAFFSEEQSNEIIEMFKAIKIKAKDFANQNAKEGKIAGLNFRRLKFYDMMFAFLLALGVCFGFSQPSYAGGNDPTTLAGPVSFQLNTEIGNKVWRVGGGNDPTMRISSMCLRESDVSVILAVLDDVGGGGHDPTIKGQEGLSNANLISPVYPDQEGGDGGGGHDPGTIQTGIEKGDVGCALKALIPYLQKCESIDNAFCNDVRSQASELLEQVPVEEVGVEI